ncbi:MAG: FMN-binding protein [Clostridia bacterium]
MIDSNNTYEEIALSEEQKNIYPNCTIENYFISGEKKIFRVISERGFVDEINLLVLLEGTTIQKIQGIDVKESENYGMNCFTGTYLTQFEGIDLAEIEVVRGKETPYDQGEIIYVTHATTTSKAIISAVNAIAVFVNS